VPKPGGSSFPEKLTELNRFRLFEYENEYEYRDAEYEKADFLPTKIPDGPNFFVHSQMLPLEVYIGTMVLAPCVPQQLTSPFEGRYLEPIPA